MTRVIALTVLAASLLCVGCAGVTREQALATATRELARRQCTLPPKHTVVVGEGVFQAEFERARPLWGVHFYVPTAHGPRELVTVLIDRRSGAVDTFSDVRRTVPSRTWAVPTKKPKHAMQPTTDRRTVKTFMTPTSHPATRALASDVDLVFR